MLKSMRRFLLPPFAALLLAMQASDSPATGFAGWLSGFAARAQAAGVSAATVKRELAGLMPDPRVIALDRAQPGSAGARPRFDAYLARHVGAADIARGRARGAAMAGALAGIEARARVPAPVLLAIWGAETSYGGFTGGFDTLRSLTTLAWEGRRAALFEGEAIAALKLIDSGRVTRAALQGSWAGATGQPQFLPSSYARYAVDGDGDGRADIWGSAADSLASIAAYLRANGWQQGAEIAAAARVSPTFDRARVRETVPAKACARPLALHSRWLTLAEWRALGVVPLDGRARADDVYATLVEPDGPGGGAWLTFGGYRAVLAYNCSNYYALSVGVLADALARDPAS